MANSVHTSSSILLWFLAITFLQVRISSADIDLHIEPAQSVEFKAIGSSLHLKCTNAFNVTKKNISLEWAFFNKKLGNKVTLNRTATAVVNIKQLSYHDEGTYTCVAKDTVSHVTQAEKSIQIIVGDPPPEPPPPVLYALYGIPPVAGTITYVLPSTAPAAYPVTIKLLLSHISQNNFCDDSLHPEFQIAEEKNISFSSKAVNLTFHADISSMLKRLFPPQNCENGLVDCDTLCGTVVVSNRFGYSDCTMPMYWNVDKKAECGKVDELKVQTSKTSIVVNWKTPKYMIHSTKNKLFFSIWCRTKCGRKITIKEKRESANYNYTINYLTPNTKYFISVSCSISDDKFKPFSTATVIAETLQDVPSEAPVIEQLRWLSDEPSVDKWTALIVWKEMKQEVLRGKLENYKLTIQNLDIPLSKPMKKQVFADKLSLKIPDLPMANYSFTVKACTGAGCGKESHHILKAFAVPRRTEDGQNKNDKVTNIRDLVTVVGLPALFIAIVLVFALTWYCLKKRSRDFPVIDVQLRSDEGNSEDSESTEPKPDNIYSNVNPACCVSMDNLKEGPGSSIMLSRASSSSTCSTVT